MAAEAKTTGLFVTKRSGELAAFDPERIRTAIERATMACGEVKLSNDALANLIGDICLEVQDRFDTEFVPNVENIQDIVEKHLMKAGLYDIAKAYILYRAKRQKERDELFKKKSFLKTLSVKKRNGRSVLFNYNKLRSTISRCAGEHTECVDPILNEVVKSIYDGISTEDIIKCLVLASSSLIERDPVYDKVAASLFMQNVYHEIFDGPVDEDNVESQYRASFVSGIHKGVEGNRLNKALLKFDLDKLASALVISRDKLLTHQSVHTLYERYWLQVDGQRTELPQSFWMRVAMGLSFNEPNRDEKAIEFYNVLSSLRFVSSTPTLFHSGMPNPQLSSCYLTSTSDDLEQIFDSFSDNALLSKWSGGLGNDWTYIRGTGSWIKSTNVNSQGVIPFLKIADSTTAAINRSGKRHGATCAYLETWHYDVEEFLDLRKNTGDDRRRTHDMNTSNWIPDLFMERVEADAEWTLFSPDETPDLHDLYGRAFKKAYEEYEQQAADGKMKVFKTVSAKKLWRKMLTMLFETGHPWLCWKDPCNVRSPQDHVGVVHSSNLCTEITLNTKPSKLLGKEVDENGILTIRRQLGEVAVCNIGSVNYAAHLKNGVLDEEMLRETVRAGICMLDNVIDDNFYPTPEAKNSNMKHRPIGLGCMGFQDVLFEMSLPFDSQEAVELSDKLQELVSYEAILTSSKIAKEKGHYQTYPGSKWDRGLLPIDTLGLLEAERGEEIPVNRTIRQNWQLVRDHIKNHGMRNSNVMAIAPTATISTIAGCLPSIEPIYKNIYVKANISGEFTIVNRPLVNDLKKLGLWNQQMMDDIKYYDGDIQMIDSIPQNLKKVYKGVFEIEPKWVIDHAAVRNKWIDQSQSVNIFIKGASGKILHETYMYAWKKGLKTTYYLRTLAASQIEKSTLDADKYGYTQKREYQQQSDDLPVKQCRIDNPDCEACQ